MKLVNLFDRLVSAGAVRPARLDADGRPQPLEHVLQLRDQPPDRPQPLEQVLQLRDQPPDRPHS